MVGKGVVFDSGGLSIKTASGMETMKTDMAGAAAVIATMSALAAPPPVSIPTIAAAVEPVADSANDAAKIVTTAEELDLFERVKKIVAQSAVKSPVAFKDTATYFGVNLGPVRRWFLRSQMVASIKAECDSCSLVIGVQRVTNSSW